jgi:hypothetical protein
MGVTVDDVVSRISDVLATSLETAQEILGKTAIEVFNMK